MANAVRVEDQSKDIQVHWPAVGELAKLRGCRREPATKGIPRRPQRVRQVQFPRCLPLPLRHSGRRGRIPGSSQEVAAGFRGFTCAGRQGLYSDIELRVTVGNDDEEAVWEYRIRFAQEQSNAGLSSRRRPSSTMERRLFGDPIKRIRVTAERKTQTYLEAGQRQQGVQGPGRFPWTRCGTGISFPELVRDPDRSVGRQNDPFGGDFLEQTRTYSSVENPELPPPAHYTKPSR